MAAPRDAGTFDDAERALRVFRDAVEHHRGDAVRIEDLRAPLERFCMQARRERMPPEQVLVHVKRALDGFHIADDRTADRQMARARIISFAIETYYADLGHGGS